jgi:hypothetical protein
MGSALAAELNGYPGPSHVLELAAQIHLSDQQRASIRQLFDAMKAESIPIGERLISRETDLDRLFADRTITPEGLIAAIAAIGDVQAELRATHLKYHLLTPALLTEHQCGAIPNCGDMPAARMTDNLAIARTERVHSPGQFSPLRRRAASSTSAILLAMVGFSGSLACASANFRRARRRSPRRRYE